MNNEARINCHGNVLDALHGLVALFLGGSITDLLQSVGGRTSWSLRSSWQRLFFWAVMYGVCGIFREARRQLDKQT